MKETKVYVDELPESCIDCPCCSCDLKPEFIKIGHFMYCNLLRQKFRFKEERKKLKDCPLIDIKTHDREKDKRIKELEQKVQELQQLDQQKAMWQKLKEWLLKAFPKRNIKNNYIAGVRDAYEHIINKMQELEGEDE